VLQKAFCKTGDGREEEREAEVVDYFEGGRGIVVLWDKPRLLPGEEIHL